MSGKTESRLVCDRFSYRGRRVELSNVGLSIPAVRSAKSRGFIVEGVTEEAEAGNPVREPNKALTGPARNSRVTDAATYVRAGLPSHKTYGVAPEVNKSVGNFFSSQLNPLGTPPLVPHVPALRFLAHALSNINSLSHGQLP